MEGQRMNELSLRKSKTILENAKKYLTMGVGSPVRAPIPFVIERGEGARIYDVDGNGYIDCMMSMGPLILGHRPPKVIAAVKEQISERGTMYGMAHPLEQEVSRKIVEAVPSAEIVCYANSGSEAVLAALRLARGYTGKDKIVRFEGQYHGWTDITAFNSFPPLDSMGPFEAPSLVNDSGGTPKLYGELTIPLPWNAPEVLEETIKKHQHEIAAIIMEPIMGNAGGIPPNPGYLEFVREIATENDIVLIFDEIITGFRVAYGGAQSYFNVIPDITTMAKGLGGGFPIAAVGGKKEIMEQIVDGRVMQAGTYCTNPLVMSAANAVLDQLAEPGTYDHLFGIGERLGSGLKEIISRAGHPVVLQGVGPMFQVKFCEEPPYDYRSAAASVKVEPFEAFQSAMMRRGVFFHPWTIELFFVSTAHSHADVDEILNAAEDAIKEVKK
jgi:glutamate-1-semialdehyde 2,1-aminomutase